MTGRGLRKRHGLSEEGGILTMFFNPAEEKDASSPIGRFLTHALGGLAREDPTLDDLVSYFQTVVPSIEGMGTPRGWSFDLYSQRVVAWRARQSRVDLSDPDWKLFYG